MHRRQGWVERTGDGEKREVRVTRTGREWHFQSRIKGAPDWTHHQIPRLEDARHFHAMLERKYRRRRAPWKDVEAMAALIQSLESSTGAPPGRPHDA